MAKKNYILLIACLLISACASAPPVKYYVLEPVALPALPKETTGRPLSIGIGPVSIPVLLDRKKIVTRMPDKSIQIAEFHQWAAPLQENFAETLAHNLSSLQPSHVFRTYPWSVHGTVDLQIVVDVLRFDSTPGDSASLEANWTIKNELNQKIIKSGRTILRYALPDSSYPATVHSLSLLMSQFSQELSSMILRLNDN